jgi:hypothetical protein
MDQMGYNMILPSTFFGAPNFKCTVTKNEHVLVILKLIMSFTLAAPFFLIQSHTEKKGFPLL